MNIKKIIMLLSPFVFLSINIHAQNNYKSYCNNRFEYCIEYPLELNGMGESDSGDGQQFRSNDTLVNLWVYRDFRDVMFESTTQCIKECFTNDIKNEDGKIVSYKKVDKDFYVISGTKGNAIFYQKTIYTASGMITALIMYDKSKKATYDSYCTYLFNTFK